jgi:hypothetical protein
LNDKKPTFIGEAVLEEVPPEVRVPLDDSGNGGGVGNRKEPIDTKSSDVVIHLVSRHREDGVERPSPQERAELDRPHYIVQAVRPNEEAQPQRAIPDL